MTKLRAEEKILLGLAGLLVVVLHSYRLTAIPGLHYDEAWAMNHAWRIAFTPGYWPLTAMSAYTAPWAHYWAAFWLWLLDSSLLVFRGSQVALSLAGLGLFCATLPRPTRLPFLFLVLALPGIVLNHRFTIELNGFHVAAGGIFCWALARGRPFMAACAAAAGTTAHILFYGIVLAAVAAAFLTRRSFSRAERNAALACFFFLAGFFLRILFLIPEKGKAAALLASALVVCSLLWVRAEKWALWEKRGWGILLACTALPFLGNALFFAFGLWSLAITTGQEPWQSPFVVGALLVEMAALAGLVVLGFRASSVGLRLWVLAAFTLVGLMMLKPAPRYFELLLLAVAALGARGLVVLGARRQWPVLVAGILLSLPVYRAYFQAPPAVERAVHFLHFKDSSRDFLSKQALVANLGGLGCKLSDIETGDPRVREALEALSRGDWPLAPHACGGKWEIFRRAESSAPIATVADFVVRRKF